MRLSGWPGGLKLHSDLTHAHIVHWAKGAHPPKKGLICSFTKQAGGSKFVILKELKPHIDRMDTDPFTIVPCVMNATL